MFINLGENVVNDEMTSEQHEFLLIFHDSNRFKPDTTNLFSLSLLSLNSIWHMTDKKLLLHSTTKMKNTIKPRLKFHVGNPIKISLFGSSFYF